MPYSIGYGSQLPLINQDSASTLNGLADVAMKMPNAFEKFGNAFRDARDLVQDNADASYNAAINKFSNDPEGLAKALANGEIDTSNVRASTLAQTQNRLKDIASGKAMSYLQQRTENANNYWDNNGKLYMQAVNDAQNGKDIGALRAQLIEAGAPAEALGTLAALDPTTQQNWKLDYQLKQRQVDNMGSALNFEKEKYQADLRGQNALFRVQSELQKQGKVSAEKLLPLYQAIATGNMGYLESMGIDISSSDLLDISNSPKALSGLTSMVGLTDYTQNSSGNTTYNNSQGSGSSTKTRSDFDLALGGINATAFTKVTSTKKQ